MGCLLLLRPFLVQHHRTMILQILRLPSLLPFCRLFLLPNRCCNRLHQLSLFSLQLLSPFCEVAVVVGSASKEIRQQSGRARIGSYSTMSKFPHVLYTVHLETVPAKGTLQRLRGA